MTDSSHSTKTAAEAHVSGPRDDDLRQRMSEVELALEVLVDVEATDEWLRPNDLWWCRDARRKDWCRDARMKEVKANLQHISELCRDGEAYRAERQSGAPPTPPPDGLRTEAEAAAQLTPPPSPRKPRRPSLATQIRRAEKSGREVTSVTLPDGTKLNFGEGEPSEANNPWLADLKVTKQ